MVVQKLLESEERQPFAFYVDDTEVEASLQDIVAEKARCESRRTEWRAR